ncbi:MAG: phosphoribosylglycinamide formyltransferase [Pseudotabrizicola sp.]|uniref:phosphoribosylglycinamide formyltransferase n=1 Tax=Pseudotabrizicola sp. TaxID=2939647 RepID=UPI00271AFD7D|nr:phosphoribosylglycinamide formyltransferase [Pseudotabrizicola sp.]MDO9640981.1 phosphoribosylglycinamide formyltransferase [Pseudotabrizicola sp.]
MTRVAILISGGGSNMLRLVQDMLANGYAQPVLVASNDPQAAGLASAAALGVATVAVDHRGFGRDRAAFEAELLKPILAANPDVLCLAGFMRVLTPDFVRRFDGRMLNIHPSLLPKYPGLHTHQRALDAGDTQAGCTVHEVTAELDAGPVLGQAVVPVLADDTADSLSARVLVQEHRLYPLVLRRFVAGQRKPLFLDRDQ